MEIKNLFNLKGKNALITGGSQGIGKAIALALAEFGANVVIHYNSNHAKAKETLKELKKYNIKCGAFSCNLQDKNCAPKLNEYTQSVFGDVDILVLNASVQVKSPFQDITQNEMDLQIDLNIKSTITLLQQFIPHMKKEKWGRIITIGSVQQKRPHPQMLVYSSTKAALVNMVTSLAPELGKYKITINNVAPGVIVTGRNEAALQNAEYAEQLKKLIPVERFGQPQDCSGICVLLASEAGSYITGTDILVDGGLSIPK